VRCFITAFTNDLPAIIAAIARATNQRQLEYKTIAFPDHGLEEHWNGREGRKEIARAKWDFVVLQQGPSSLPESRVLLREYVKKFADEIKRVGAKPVPLPDCRFLLGESTILLP